MGTVGWHGSGVLSSFSLPLGYIVRPICGRVYPNDGRAVENQVERHTTGRMARWRLGENIKQVGAPVDQVLFERNLVNVNGELDR